MEAALEDRPKPNTQGINKESNKAPTKNQNSNTRNKCQMARHLIKYICQLSIIFQFLFLLTIFKRE